MLAVIFLQRLPVACVVRLLCARVRWRREKSVVTVASQERYILHIALYYLHFFFDMHQEQYFAATGRLTFFTNQAEIKRHSIPLYGIPVIVSHFCSRRSAWEVGMRLQPVGYSRLGTTRSDGVRYVWRISETAPYIESAAFATRAKIQTAEIDARVAA